MLSKAKPKLGEEWHMLHLLVVKHYTPSKFFNLLTNSTLTQQYEESTVAQA